MGAALFSTRDAHFSSRSRRQTYGGSVAVLAKLLSRYCMFSEHVRLAAFRKGKNVEALNQRVATRAPRYSGTMGEISERMVQIEGTGKSGIDTYKVTL